MDTAPSLPPVSHVATQARRLEARAHLAAKDGKTAESLNLGAEAVSAWREAAKENERFIPDLARYLGQFSARNRTLERVGEALDAAIESVRLWRKLANQDFERYGFGLFQAIMGLAPQAAKRHHQDYFTLFEEATQLLFRLLPTDEARFLLPTAQACQRLANIGGSYGHPRKALSYAERAVELWGRLAEQDLIEYGPRLVLALRRLSIEQLDPRVGWGKAAQREARRVKLAYLKLRLLNVFGIRRSTPGNRGGTAPTNGSHEIDKDKAVAGRKPGTPQ